MTHLSQLLFQDCGSVVNDRAALTGMIQEYGTRIDWAAAAAQWEGYA